jgi:hypothetical protein
MDDKRKDAERIVDSMEKETELSRIEELIKDNRITFDYKDKKYRVRLLNLSEKEELDILRRKKFGQLLKDKDVFLEKDLIVQYKERGINIDELDDQAKKFTAEELELQMKLGEAISKSESETILKNYKEQIEDLRTKKSILFTQKNLLLELSLENALLSYVAQIITYLSLELLEGKTWKRMFTSLESFQKYEDNRLIDKAASYSILLQQI